VTSSQELKVVATAANQAEGELICALLAAAAISAIEQRASGNPEFGSAGARYIYVQAADLERAGAALQAGEQPISDEELARQSEEAGRAALE
jgi:hypothetical protein